MSLRKFSNLTSHTLIFFFSQSITILESPIIWSLGTPSFNEISRIIHYVMNSTILLVPQPGEYHMWIWWFYWIYKTTPTPQMLGWSWQASSKNPYVMLKSRSNMEGILVSLNLKYVINSMERFKMIPTNTLGKLYLSLNILDFLSHHKLFTRRLDMPSYRFIALSSNESFNLYSMDTLYHEEVDFISLWKIMATWSTYT